MLDGYKRYNVCVMRRQKKREEIFKRMTEISPKIMPEIEPEIQETKVTPSRINAKKVHLGLFTKLTQDKSQNRPKYKTQNYKILRRYHRREPRWPGV